MNGPWYFLRETAHNIDPERGWKQKDHMSDEVFLLHLHPRKKSRDDPGQWVIRTDIIIFILGDTHTPLTLPFGWDWKNSTGVNRLSACFEMYMGLRGILPGHNVKFPKNKCSTPNGNARRRELWLRKKKTIENFKNHLNAGTCHKYMLLFHP